MSCEGSGARPGSQPQSTPDDSAATPAPTTPRVVSDPQTMRALTHPVRQALLELLLTEGPMTATQAGERIGEPPNTCSFHFRQLAKYGFVEEAGKGPGRTRPWKLTTAGMRFTDLHEDTETALAARALDRMLRERYFARLQAFYDTRSSYPRRWQEVTGGSEFLLHVSPEELHALDEQITGLLLQYRDRITDPSLRPEDSLPVEVLLFAYPIRPAGD
ncbi:MAG: helix-turn-helix transcriptional regulator [Actinobacteria bacterium]|nr:helix-turn-helix transcriptional regulator [Actinomycetota bacterium]